MPTKVSARRQRGQKRMKLHRRPFDPEQKLINAELVIIRREHEKRLRVKELARLEKIRLEKERQNRSTEVNSLVRANNWTGLRVQPDNDKAGRNWTTYSCLKRRRKSFPSELMVLINQFLNWVPAGCWLTTDIGCSGCGIKFLDSQRLGTSVCSWQCYEIELRNRILSDYDMFVNDITDVTTLFDEDCPILTSKYKYNRVLYKNYDEILDWHLYWNTPREYYEQLDQCDKLWGICYYIDNDQLSVDTPLDSLIDDVKRVLAVQEYSDDVWQIYRPHWTDRHVHVFPN